MSPLIETDDYMRPTTAANILGVGRARVQQLIAAGILPAIQIDGHWYLHRGDVEARRDQMADLTPPRRKTRRRKKK
jgi:excisionase family DNA binding protein